MAIVERSPQYLSDLDDIWFYIAQDSPTNADRFIDRIRDTVKRIAETSLMGRNAEALSPGLRQFPIGNYLFFYQPLLLLPKEKKNKAVLLSCYTKRFF